MIPRWTRARCLAVPLALLIAHGTVPAVRTRTWTESTGEIQAGRADGVSVTRHGRLTLAPRVTRLGAGASAGAAHVWAAATDSRGNVYLGTGPEGKILKFAPGGAETVLATIGEPMVTALLVLPDGAILAGTAPDGKVYRVRSDGSAEIWCKTGERYVWSLVLGADGAVYAGTGDAGIVLRIGSSGKAEPFFDSDESHITALTLFPSGGLVAGGAGRGLVYRLDAKGDASVLHDTEMSEVSQIVVEPDGSIVVATLSSPEPEPRPPAVRFRVPQNASVGSTRETALDPDERNASTLEGVIEGLSSEGGEARSGRRPRGRVVRIAPSGSTTEIWRSASEAPLALALDDEGRPLFGTGEPGRIYRVAEGGDVDLLATVREAQVTRLVRAGGLLLAATSNPAALYRMERSPATSGVFVSRPFDAQAPARWGTLRWRGEGPPGGVEFQARSGNSADPDGTWSDWGPVITDSQGARTEVPEGRFLQWRARLSGATGAQPRLGEVTVSFVTQNRPPALDDFRLDGGLVTSNGPVKLRWNASDPDADPVAVRVEYRAPASLEWKTALLVEPPGTPAEDGDGGDPWKEGKGTWETSDVAEGSYEVRAVASDRQANAPLDGKEFVWEPGILVLVDRTPPEIEPLALADGTLEVSVTDGLTPVRRLEVLDGERVLFVLPPVDGVADSRRETFRVPSNTAAPPRRLRAFDAAGNTGTREVAPR